MSDFISVYVTYPDPGVAESISRRVVEARLAACANIMPQGTSLYWWDGGVQTEPETYVLYKTTRALFAALEAEIREQHPYDVPCIVAMDIMDGHVPYLDWIKGETKA